MNDEIAINQSFQALENFIKIMNQAPSPEICRERDKRQYVEIRIIEKLLDELYSGLWSTENFRWNVIANEIVGSIDLKVFHPVAKVWITRTGSGGKQIRMKSKENGGDGDITNVRNKLTTALEADFPNLKAVCIHNAAKSLGAVFGRNLNIDTRSKFTANLQTLSEKATEFEQSQYVSHAIELLCEHFDNMDIDTKTKESYKANCRKFKTVDRVNEAMRKLGLIENENENET